SQSSLTKFISRCLSSMIQRKAPTRFMIGAR
ncbi:aconitase family protein, partial [Vibrio parahaemolyticus IDH02640]